MPGLSKYTYELSKYAGRTYSKVDIHNTSNHATFLKCILCPFNTKSIVAMERHKFDVHASHDLESAYSAHNPELLSPEKNTDERDLEIEVLDIDEFGILSNVEVDEQHYSNSIDGHESNDFGEKVSCSSADRDASSSLSCNTRDKNYAKPQVRNYKCSHCGFLTRNSREYLHHLQNVHKANFFIHECDYCEYASKHIKNLQRHCSIIHGAKTQNDSKSNKQFSKILARVSSNPKLKSSGKLKCNLCSFSTTSERLLSAHTCHNQTIKEESVETEDIYSSGFKTIIKEEGELNFYSNNEKVELKGQKNHKCPICKMNIRWNSWLIRHLRHSHRGNSRAESLADAYEKKSKHYRPRRKVNNNIFQIIKDINIPKRPANLFASSVSKYSQMNFDNFGSLPAVTIQSMSNCKEISRKKSQVQSDNAIKCNVCFYKFKSLIELQEHMQCHSTSASDFSSKCDFGLISVKNKNCNNFNDVSSLNHNAPIISNTGEQSALLRNVRAEFGSKLSNQKYQCPYCPFTISSVLRFHIHFIQHMKNLLFKCSDCDYHSRWKWTVIKHIWSKNYSEKNHFNAYVMTNNKLVDLNSFELYRKYLVNFNEPKPINYQLNLPQLNAVQENQSTWFQSAKSDFLYNDNRNVNSPIETAITRETKYFFCKECNFKNVSKKIVINHLAIHAGVKPFQCSVCDLKSRWKHVIVRHIRNAHVGHNGVIEQKIHFIQEGFVLCQNSAVENGDKTYENPKVLSHKFLNCDICPYKTSKQYHMNFHMKQHKCREGVKYKCDKCPFFVKFSKSLIKHKKLHDAALTAAVEESFNVDYKCIEEFESSTLVEISPKKYFRKKRLVCSKCPARFSQHDRFNRHLELHGKDYKFKCSQCDYSVQVAVNLVKHTRLHEVKKKLEYFGNSKSFTCPFCRAIFSLEDRYKRHLKLHNKNYSDQRGFSVLGNANAIKPNKLHCVKRKLEFPSLSKSLKCPKCPTVFSSQERYTRHLDLHGKNYKFTCSQCDYSVQNAVNIQKHEKIHSIKNLPESLDYPVSSETLNGVDNAEEPVAVEMVANTNERKLYICDRCPYNSVNKNAVQGHQRSHWMKQGLECPHCDYSSMHRSSLHSHLKLHLEGSKLFPPEAFMKFQSFKIYVQEENGDILVFDDATMINEESEKSVSFGKAVKSVDFNDAEKSGTQDDIKISETQDDVLGIKETAENNQNYHSIKHSELEVITENQTNDCDAKSVPNSHSNSSKEPIVVLTDIIDKSNSF